MILTPEDIRAARAVSAIDKERVHRILVAVSQASGVSVDLIRAKRRGGAGDKLRQLVMFVAHREGIHENVIAEVLHRERSTVLHGVKAEQERRNKEAQNLSQGH